MPSRNIIRQDAPDAYYHVYARGINRAPIFHGAEDKEYFLYLFARHLSVEQKHSKFGYAYPHYRDELELLAYCLMDNHFHLLVYQAQVSALSAFMKSIMAAYTAYYNRTYSRRGPLFESRFKAVMINHDAYLSHISRYIHLNPRSWKYFPYSSLIHIRKGTEPEWLHTGKILAAYASREAYVAFVADYEDHKNMLAEIKYELADT
jgi:REP element-mobilizing transposase RayT